MNNTPDFFIFDHHNTSLKTIVGNKSKSNWNLRKSLQNQHLEPLKNTGPSQTKNAPHLYKSIHDNNHPSIQSDLKMEFIQNEQFQSKLISPSINIKLPKL